MIFLYLFRFSADNAAKNLICTILDDGKLSIWDKFSGHLVVDGKTKTIKCITLQDTSKKLIVGTDRGCVHVYAL